jgi:hypothetical protein
MESGALRRSTTASRMSQTLHHVVGEVDVSMARRSRVTAFVEKAIDNS